MKSTIAEMLLAQAESDKPALYFDDLSWTWREYIQACSQFANLLLEQRQDGPFHVGVLLDNVPYFPVVLGGAALAGAAIVGMNPTRRGAELERDFSHSDCQIVITENAHLADLEDVNLPVPAERVYNVDTAQWSKELANQADKPIPKLDIDPTSPMLLIFTSGTTGDPKAAICSQGRLAITAQMAAQLNSFTADDVCYLAMPLFHSNSIMANWSPALSVGASVVLRRKFSASGFLPDVRRYGCTYMNYVGKPLTYILATPEQPNDADNSLRMAFGNEAVVHDIERFEKRFGCAVYDNYGSTEGGISITRTPETPKTALGIGIAGTVVLNAETGEECAIAQFDEHGRLTNTDDAVGELANIETAAYFEGYWRNEAANEERIRNSIFWSGDLGYKDAEGFLYFGGRNYDWLRVDGENFAAAPIETIVTRSPMISMAAVYAVPNAEVGDDVMVTVTLQAGIKFSADEFYAFLCRQNDMGAKSMPRYIRVAADMPMTASNKIVKKTLRKQRWQCDEPVWYRPGKHDNYRLLTADDRRSIAAKFEARGKAHELD